MSLPRPINHADVNWSDSPFGTTRFKGKSDFSNTFQPDFLYPFTYLPPSPADDNDIFPEQKIATI
jgi:hypothetical protein